MNPKRPMRRDNVVLLFLALVVGGGWLAMLLFHGLVKLACSFHGRPAPTFGETANVVKSSPLDILGGYSPPIEGGTWIYVVWWIVVVAAIAGIMFMAFRTATRREAESSGKTLPSRVKAVSFKYAVKAAKPITPKETPREQRVVDLGNFHNTPIYGQHKDSMLVMAPSQSGKTSGFAVPWVLDAVGPCLGATTKPDLVSRTYYCRYKKYGPVATFDPVGLAGLKEQIRYSPPAGCEEDLDEALKRGAALASGGRKVGSSSGNMEFFDDNAGTVLSMYLHAAARKPGGTMRDVFRWTSDFNDETPMRILNESELAVSVGWPDTLAGLTRSGADQTVGSLQMTLLRTLRPLMSPKVMELVCPEKGETTFDVDAFLNSTGTLYVLSETGPGSVAPIITMLSDFVIRRAQRLALSQPGERLWPPFRAVLDEVTNIAPIPNLDQMMSDTGGRGISLRALVQTYAQMQETWGDKKAKSIRENAAAEYYLPGIGDLELLEELSKRTRKFRAQRMSVSSGHRPGEGSSSVSTEWDHAMQTQDITEMSEGHALLFYRNLPYMELKMTPYWERADYPLIQEGMEAYRQLQIERMK